MYLNTVSSQKPMRWSIALKTKSVRAKPLINLLVDRAVASKFLVQTLEGRELLGDGVVICLGESNDIWQQMPQKLLEKYNVVSIDADGWMVCEPRPNNATYAVEVTQELLDKHGEPPWDEEFYKLGDFYVKATWGQDSPIGQIQYGKVGDFVCRNTKDAADTWIVRRKIFNNTYSIQ